MVAKRQAESRSAIRPNPDAGRREMAWLQQHRAELADSGQPWVAILNDRVIARAATPADLFEQLRGRDDIQDALIVRVKSDNGQRVHRIA